jgi:hypothetical protein
MNVGVVLGWLVILNTPHKLYNFSTYTLARFQHITVTKKEDSKIVIDFSIKKGDLILTGHIVNYSSSSPPVFTHLRAPWEGEMKLFVQEWNSAEVKLELLQIKNGKRAVLFEGYGTNAGLEVEGDTDWIMKHV